MKFNRFFIVSQLIVLFLAIIVAISSCGLATELASTDLQNSISANNENGLGSGKWQPPAPQNQNQCTQLYSTMDAFRVDINTQVNQYDNGFSTCFDKDGNLREGQSGDACYPPLSDLTEDIQNSLVDFQAGSSAYNNTCSIMFETAPVLVAPNLPKFDPVSTSGIDQGGGWGVVHCLTCTHNIENTEYAFIPLSVDITSLNN